MPMEDNAEKFLIITISGIDYSIPVSEVESVLTLRKDEISNVPFDTDSLLYGIFSYRGGVTAILRPEILPTREDDPGTECTTAVLLRYGRKSFAVLCDHAKAVEALSADSGITELSAARLYGVKSNV